MCRHVVAPAELLSVRPPPPPRRTLRGRRREATSGVWLGRSGCTCCTGMSSAMTPSGLTSCSCSGSAGVCGRCSALGRISHKAQSGDGKLPMTVPAQNLIVSIRGGQKEVRRRKRRAEI